MNQVTPDAIRALRERLGLGRAAFAARYGLSPRLIESWEQNRRHPDPAALVLLRLIDRDAETIARLLQDEPPDAVLPNFRRIRNTKTRP